MNRASNRAAINGPRRCVCGKCVTCVDNDRWERIFQEKFGQQERDYYAEAREPRSSGVSCKAFADASIYAYAEERETPSEIKGYEEQNLERFLKYVRQAGNAAGKVA
jgi:hypothetical protein